LATESAARLGLEVSFLDSGMFPTNSLFRISSAINDANIVLADLSHTDPFVSYVVSIAQCLGKKIMMVSTQIDCVPFDVRSYRVEITQPWVPDSVDRISQAMKDVLASESIVGPLGGTIVYGQNLFLRRICAFLLDTLPFGTAAALAWWKMESEMSEMQAIEGIGLIYFAYSSLCTSLMGNTLGQRFLGLKVVTMNGDRLKLGRSFGREFLGGLVFALSYGLGFLWSLKRPSFRALHDIASDSLVVRGSITPHTHSRGTGLVIMPFQDDLKWHFDLLRKAGAQLGLEVSRVDTYAYSGNILQAIAGGLSKADLIIADVTNSNPNVAYELSIAQCLGKRILCVCEGLAPGFADFPHGIEAIDSDSEQQLERIRDAMDNILNQTYVTGPFGEGVLYGQRLFTRRIAALLLDVIPMFLFVAILETALSFFGIELSRVKAGWDINSLWSYLMIVPVFVAPLVIYDAVATTVVGGTPGQLLLGLRVVRLRGGKVGLWRALWRSLLTFVLGPHTAEIDYLWSLKGPAYSPIHDILSGTKVVKR
jgi:uncharacterized RDD family membrane protein YckC